MADLNALVEEKINSDSDFQATLADMSEEDQTQAIADKRTELLNQEFTSLSEKAAKADELAKNQKIRAEKAEQEAKKNKPAGEETPKTSEKKEEYSLEDTIAIINDKVTEKEDIETVKKFAKLENISIAEALKSPIVKTILSTKAEERRTAQATNTGKGGKATSKDTPEAILQRAESGQFPDDDDGLKKFAEARLQAKIDKIKT